MDWYPVISEQSVKGVVIGAIVAVGTVTMLLIGMRETRAFLLSIPVASLIAVGLHYWHRRHKVDPILLLGDKDTLNLDRKR